METKHYDRSQLSQRERQIQELAQQGLDSTQIAHRLGIARGTVAGAQGSIRKRQGRARLHPVQGREE